MTRRSRRRARGPWSAVVPETDEWTCPACGYVPVDEVERARHKDGVDEKHLTCAHQDIDAIKARQLPAGGSFNGSVWG